MKDKASIYNIGSIYSPYQYATIPAGSSQTLYLLEPEPYIAFIRYVANSWYPNTYLEWRIDNEVVERIERQIAPANAPLKLERPYVCRYKMEVVAYNNDSVSHSFYFLGDGDLLFLPERL